MLKQIKNTKIFYLEISSSWDGKTPIDNDWKIKQWKYSNRIQRVLVASRKEKNKKTT